MNLGIEIEFTGVKRIVVAEALSALWHTEVVSYIENHFDGSTSESYKIKDLCEGYWRVVRDRSIKPDCARGHITLDYEEYMCELVSPVLKNEDDMDMLKMALASIIDLGGFVNETCGVHIHIDCPQFGEDVYNLFMKVVSKQDSFISDFGVPYNRLGRYCQMYPKEFISGFKEWHEVCLKEKRYMSISDIQNYFYEKLGEGADRNDPKNPARYYVFNMDSIHKLYTLEFRWFNSSLSILVIKMYILYIKDLLVASGYIPMEG